MSLAIYAAGLVTGAVGCYGVALFAARARRHRTPRLYRTTR